MLFSTQSLKPSLTLAAAREPPKTNVNAAPPTEMIFEENSVPSRTVTKWSLSKGKRKSVKAVVKRFYRLEWGAWIRTLAGRNKKKWRKTGKRLNRGKKHLFVNATQSTLLDKMVTKFWRRRRFYIEDPYEPYHSREEFPISARKPH
nr:EOG090X0J5E [Eulimnadia texana]